MKISIIFLVALQFIGLGWNIGKHGESRTIKYNGWQKLILVIIVLTLYHFAGLFKVFNL